MKTEEIIFIIVILLLILFIFLWVFIFIGNNSNSNMKTGTFVLNVADHTVPFKLYFATIESLSNVIVNWGDGTIQNIPIGSDIFEHSHTYPEDKDYTVTISSPNLEYFGNINNEIGTPDQINKIKSVDFTKLTDLKFLILYDTLIETIDISTLKLLQNLTVAKGTLTQEGVNNILIDFNIFGTNPFGVESGVLLALQLAPTGEGLTAEQSLISRGWNVVTA